MKVKTCLFFISVAGMFSLEFASAWPYEAFMWDPNYSPANILRERRILVNGEWESRRSQVRYTRLLSHTSNNRQVGELWETHPDKPGEFRNLDPSKDNFTLFDIYHWVYNCHGYTFDVPVWWNSHDYVKMAFEDDYVLVPKNSSGAYQWGSDNFLFWDDVENSHSCIVHSLVFNAEGEWVIDEVYSINGARSIGAYSISYHTSNLSTEIILKNGLILNMVGGND